MLENFRDAWNSLGEMSKEEAMRGYIDALKQVVETMSVDSNVQVFFRGDILMQKWIEFQSRYCFRIFWKPSVQCMSL